MKNYLPEWKRRGEGFIHATVRCSGDDGPGRGSGQDQYIDFPI